MNKQQIPLTPDAQFGVILERALRQVADEEMAALEAEAARLAACGELPAPDINKFFEKIEKNS